MQWRSAQVQKLRRKPVQLCLCLESKRPSQNVGHNILDNYSKMLTPFSATEHNQDMIRLLTDLQGRVSEVDRMRIESALSTVSQDVADAVQATKSAEQSRTPADDERGEANTSAEVGSNEDLDLIDEDLLRTEQTRATGFMGKNSEVQWLRRLARNTEEDVSGLQPRPSGPYGPPGVSAEAFARRGEALRRRQEKDTTILINTSTLSFYLDDEKVELDFLAESWELPPFETAERLLSSYMETVHDTFPIVAKKPLLNRFYQHYASVGRTPTRRLPQRWQGMLNIVFAIGAAYSHLTEENWRADDRDHFIYHSRAWSLTLKDPWWFSHPDLPQLQITGLLAIYYLSIGHINRAWTVVGMSLRFAYALGLHLRNEDRAASAVKKESLRRIWWGLYVLEGTLSSLTGRPSQALESQCSVPLPLPLSTEEMEEAIIISRFGSGAIDGQYGLRDIQSEMTTSPDPSKNQEPANSGSYLKATIKIGTIVQQILSNLYSAQVATKSWEDVQNIISQLSEKLETWASLLPPSFSMAHDKSHPQYRDRTGLEISYWSAKIILTRPCLCRLDRHIVHQSERSHNFNRKTAEVCVDAALNITRLLPDEPFRNRTQIYKIGPWWSMVHIVMQALTVMLLEMSNPSFKTYDDHKSLTQSFKKLIRWLRSMKANNAMAIRAYRIAFSLMKRVAARNPELDISELLDEESGELVHTVPLDLPHRTDPLTSPHEPLDQFARDPAAFPSLRTANVADGNIQQDLSDGFPTSLDAPQEKQLFFDSSEFDTSGPANEFFDFLPSQTAFSNLMYTGFDEHNVLPVSMDDNVYAWIGTGDDIGR
ncbi:fungal-specific transcription factor domain-containing protein [Dendryphion nanum]|uniref:Fungal-specific transcription factor domain-containing protein n=1 Tax=Dendryphion nanum TaxID=256645 RepID=A0A9P9DXD3_9PLEO|nr:fungal-specific transcription factor domain-containing protein [Dendryphion nanum]